MFEACFQFEEFGLIGLGGPRVFDGGNLFLLDGGDTLIDELLYAVDTFTGRSSQLVNSTRRLVRGVGQALDGDGVALNRIRDSGAESLQVAGVPRKRTLQESLAVLNQIVQYTRISLIELAEIMASSVYFAGDTVKFKIKQDVIRGWLEGRGGRTFHMGLHPRQNIGFRQDIEYLPFLRAQGVPEALLLGIISQPPSSRKTGRM